MSDFTELAIAGRVATPSDSDWDEARLAWNLAADQRPEAVAFAESADDVAATVRFAAENGLRVAGQGTGHGAAALRAARGHDPDQDRADARDRGRPRRADAPGSRPACSSLELGEAAQAHGLCSLPGSSPDVGVDRLHARRRPQLARPPLRLRLQPGAGDRAGHRRRRGSARSTPRTSPTSSGRCAAAAAATRSSPPCSSTCCRSPRSTPAPCSSRPRSAPRRCAPTATGPPASPTRSPRSSASSPRRRSPTCPSRSAACRC